MNIELAIVEPEYRSQSARICLCIDSFFEEYYGKEAYQEYQELSMDYLKKRYILVRISMYRYNNRCLYRGTDSC